MASVHPADGSGHGFGAAHPSASGVTIREELADAIPGIVERDRFLLRVVHLVARHADQALVAIYTRGIAGGDFVLRASTMPQNSPAPTRLAVDGNGHASVIRSSRGSGNAALIATLRDGDDAIGALVAFQAHGGFSRSDQRLVESLAEEIAPAVLVAERHHAVKQHSVVDLSSGVYANWFLNQRLEEEIERARRQGRGATVVLLQVDGVDLVWSEADFLGGTTLLRELANVLTSSTRMFDVVAQRAPGEFAILLVDSAPDDAAVVVDRIRARVTRALDGSMTGESGVHVAASHAAYPVDGEDATSLILTAEHRLDEQVRRSRSHASR